MNNIIPQEQLIIINQSMINQKLNRSRLKKTKILSQVLACFPFVRCVILNGSLAQNKSKQSSDIDLLIITKTKRIFSARFFIVLFSSIIGIKRSRDTDHDHSGKYCFNYFLIEDYLQIPTGRGEKIDQYCADNYSHSLFLAGSPEIFNKFFEANTKLFQKYGYKSQKIEIKSSRGNRCLVSLFQQFIELFFGNWFEDSVKKYQIKRIKNDPITRLYPDLIVYNDCELRFHPPK